MRKIVTLQLALIASACAPTSQPPEADSAPPVAQIPALPTDPVTQWMECEECREGQLAAVVELGDQAVGALSTLLSGGPPSDRVQVLDRALRSSYEQLAESGADGLPTEAEYVSQYTANYVAQYQARAARALSEIGSPQAVRALQTMDTTAVREDVRGVLRDARTGGR